MVTTGRSAASKRHRRRGRKHKRTAAQEHHPVDDCIVMIEQLCLSKAFFDESINNGFLDIDIDDLIWAMGEAPNGYTYGLNMFTGEYGLVPTWALTEPLFVRPPWYGR